MRISVFIIGFLFEKISLRAGCRNEKGKCFEHPAAFLPGDMPCSITLNFTVDKICVKLFVDSEAMVAYNAKKMFAARIQTRFRECLKNYSCNLHAPICGRVLWQQRNRRENSYDDY